MTWEQNTQIEDDNLDYYKRQGIPYDEEVFREVECCHGEDWDPSNKPKKNEIENSVLFFLKKFAKSLDRVGFVWYYQINLRGKWVKEEKGHDWITDRACTQKFPFRTNVWPMLLKDRRKTIQPKK